MALSNKVLLVIISILFVALMLNIFFGCRSVQEGCEAKEMTEEAIAAIKDMDPKKASELVQKMLKTKGVITESKESDEEKPEEEPSEEGVEEEAPKKDNKSSKIVKDILAKEEGTKEKRPLTEKEMELFEAISKDQVSNEDLEKLVKAGIITEGLVERFLNTLQDDVSTKSEAVVEGFSCQRDFATF